MRQRQSRDGRKTTRSEQSSFSEPRPIHCDFRPLSDKCVNYTLINHTGSTGKHLSRIGFGLFTNMIRHRLIEARCKRIIRMGNWPPHRCSGILPFFNSILSSLQRFIGVVTVSHAAGKVGHDGNPAAAVICAKRPQYYGIFWLRCHGSESFTASMNSTSLLI